MLDTDTKRRIDTARDILVGKVPNPQSQVEQITIALIYKFMDDMDAESEELGGKRSFFAGEYVKYGWAKLMAVGIEGHEMMGLYAEGIARMPENMGIPQLFRDIFKNAYLPYRDPETLKSFLKIINEFSYDHSERLGDAFEYLLSVLGSQGDAGQFRTPRHIIDFMVEVMQPKLGEVVLDPACGTAGFLISAYKHILKKSVDDKGVSTLTPKARGKLATNFKGYDISPDMVRLSNVNLYLHGFLEPQIYEYDTLTSDERWNESADVVLANPPFMSPKGGIKPHKRFSIQAKRSEVLFVDYIAEHLSPQGRAAIIVPEGIIFQSQGAYKDLRKMLVENSLVAVISLPAGVFQPYSGVKTSILILDKSLAKQAQGIAFFKIENDGYGLGAQRRAIAKNDLPNVKNSLGQYLQGLRANNDLQALSDMASVHGMVVSKDKIALSGDYNLSGERYREGDQRSSVYPHVELGEVVDILDSKRRPITKGDRKPGPYPYYGATGILDYVEGYLFDEPLVLIGEDGAKWGAGENSAFAVEGKVWVNNHAHVVRPKRDQLLDRFLIEILNEADLMQHITGVTVPKLNQEKMRGIQIPLPPLDIQKQIVAEIEGYQKVIDGARAVVDNYRPRIDVQADWPMVTLGEVIKLSSGRGLTQTNMKVGTYPVYGGNGINGAHAEYFLDEKNIVIGRVGAYCGAVHITEPKAWITDNGLYITEFKQPIELSYLAQMLVQLDLNQYAKVGGQPSISQTTVYERSIPLPPIPIQQSIVAEIEAEQALVAANRELIVRFEKKIAAVLARVWGE